MLSNFKYKKQIFSEILVYPSHYKLIKTYNELDSKLMKIYFYPRNSGIWQLWVIQEHKIAGLNHLAAQACPALDFPIF